MDRRTGFADRFVQKLIPARWAIFFIAGVVFMAGGAGYQQVVFEPSVLSYFDERSDSLQEFRVLERRFGRSNEIVFVIHTARDVLDPSILTGIRELRRRLERIEGVHVVRSILDLAPQGESSAGLTAEQLSEALDKAVDPSDPDINAFLSEDRTVTAVAAIIRRTVDDGERVALLAAQAREVATAVRPLLPDAEALVTGRVMIQDAFQNEGRNDLNGPAGLQLALIPILLFVVFRSWTATAALMGVVFVATVATLGALGWLGMPLNGISSAAPAVLLSLAVATGVHLVLAWQSALRDGSDRSTAVAASIQKNFAPVSLSVATTGASFLCLNLAASPPFRQLGNVVALGLLFTFVLCFTLLPALLLSIPGSTAPHRLALEAGLARFASRVTQNAGAVAGLCLAVTLLAMYGVAHLDYDDRFTHYFDESYEIRRATDLFEEKLTGTTILAISVPADPPGSATAGPHLERIDDFAKWLRSASGIRRVVTQRAARAQDFSVRMVDADERYSRVEVVLSDRTAAQTLAFAETLKDEARRRFGADVIVTGMPILTARMSLESARTMLIATALALIAISGMLVISVRSFRLGLVSLVPNVLPVLVAFGLWGVVVGDVSFAATVVAALTFGIVVDDTVHILLRYRAARLNGASPREAITSSFRSVGLAVVVTTVIIGAGFSVYSTSGFLVNQHFSILSTLTLAAALIADVVFLPPLLVLADRGEERPDGRLPGDRDVDSRVT